MSQRINFELPENIRFSEELGLELIFQEVNVRGSKERICQVHVSEEGLNEFTVQDVYEFESWESMKRLYPEMKDFLMELQNNEKWNAEWRDNDRIFYIKSVSGAEGLYDMKETVWFDAKDLNQVEEVEQPKKHKGMKKK